jgi:integration host factor subunit beta
MIRSELITELSNKHPQLTASDVELAVKTIIDSLANCLAKGGRVEMRWVRSFNIHTRPPRLGRNPRTRGAVQVPAKYVPHFRVGKELRERVNSK